MYDSKTIDAYVDFAEKHVRPTFYGVGTIKQSLGPIIGQEDVYAGEYRRFLIRATNYVYGRRLWRDHKTLIANFGTLEGNGVGKKSRVIAKGNATLGLLDGIQSGSGRVRYHLNIMLRPPEAMPSSEVIDRVQRAWRESPWTMELKIEPRTGNCVRYSLKEGLGTVLADSLSAGPDGIVTA